jgi:NADPH2:quinone reductase
VEAAGVNFIDTYQRSGAYKVALPHAMGMEGAGIVEASAADVSSPAPGDRVAWTNVPGSYATHVLLPADRTVPVPPGIEPGTAAAAMLQGMTAHYLVRSTYRVTAADTCLVHAAAGGVGLLLTQMAKRAGARVFGTVSTARKAALAEEAGADVVVRYTEEDFLAAVRRLTEGKGLQVAYDSVGRDTFDRSLQCLAPRGMMVLFGQSSGAVPPIDLQVLASRGSLFVTRPTLGHYIASREELLARAADVFGAIAEDVLHVRIHGAFPLAEAARAHEELEGRRTTGKLLLLPPS